MDCRKKTTPTRIVTKDAAFLKKDWETPKVMELKVEVIRQEEMELYQQMISDPELFQRITGTNPEY